MSPLSSNARLGSCSDPRQGLLPCGSPRSTQSWPSPRARKQQRSSGEFFFPIRARGRRWRSVRAMRIVGLTGGIASGKSTVSNLFKSHDVPVVDADLVARDVVRKGTVGWKKVVAAFGDNILLENGEIDRACMGQIIFSDSTKRQLLNRLLAPYISFGIFWEAVKLWIKGSKLIILDIPLLFEAKMDRWTAPIIVVWVDPETQVTRLMARDGISEEQAKSKINAQTALDWKKTKAHIVIDNSGTLEETKQQFQEVLNQVSRPLTWKEFAFSREGVFWILVSAIAGVLVVQKNLKR